ncbi:Translation elongation factor EF1B/ribosomal protein S6 family protein [Euphorbia peplus]|nr:Translation elongation factor EF1B/ribosomal protein S6 family protein [Euphorbia peplus]
MPLYDCMLLLKPHITKDGIVDLVTRVGKHVYSRNGVLTDVKTLGEVQLGYGIKKLDGKYFQGQLMQMTMMATPNINKELHYLNKEDRLLRWLLVKHRDTKYADDFLSKDEASLELSQLSRTSFINVEEKEKEEEEEDSNEDENKDANDDEDDDDDDDDDEYDVDLEEKK